MLRPVLPVVNYILACYNDMSFVHGHELRLDADILCVNWAPYSIAEDDYPLTFYLLGLGYKNTVLSKCCNFLESSHVFDMLLINHCVPKDNAHVVPLRLSKSEN
jgi:hypothetical protein